MGKILQLNPKQPVKFDFERVRKRKKSGDKPGQLNLFASSGAQILKLPADIGPFEEALLLDERGDVRAEEAYERAIAAGDDVADAYCNLGIIESKAGRPAKAFDCFTRSLEIDPRHFESHYNLGNLYLEEGDLRLARLHYESAAEVEPSSFPNLYFNLGLAHALGNNYEAALRILNKYRDLAPGDESNKADELLANLERSLTTKK